MKAYQLIAWESQPELREVPLVLVTSSYVEPNDRELARRAGANDLVIRTPELVESIDLLRDTLAATGRTSPLDAESLPQPVTVSRADGQKAAGLRQLSAKMQPADCRGRIGL